MVCKKWHEALDEGAESPVWRQVLEDPELTTFVKSPLLRGLHGNKAKLVAFDNAWSERDCSPHMSILSNSLTLHRNPVAQSTDAIRGKRGYFRGQHYWTVTWHKPAFGSNAVIGVATSDEVVHTEGYHGLLGSSYESWGWDIPEGTVRHGGKTLGKYPQADKQVSFGVGLLCVVVAVCSVFPYPLLYID
jgi:F-box protein 45